MRYNHYKSWRKNLLFDPSAQATQVLKYTKSLQPSSTPKRLQRDCKKGIFTHHKIYKVKNPNFNSTNNYIENIDDIWLTRLQGGVHKEWAQETPPNTNSHHICQHFTSSTDLYGSSERKISRKKIYCLFLLFFWDSTLTHQDFEVNKMTSKSGPKDTPLFHQFKIWFKHGIYGTMSCQTPDHHSWSLHTGTL